MISKGKVQSGRGQLPGHAGGARRSTHSELHREHFCEWDGAGNEALVVGSTAVPKCSHSEWPLCMSTVLGPREPSLCVQVGAVRGAQLPRPHVRGGARRVQQLQRVAGAQRQRPVHQESRQLLLAELSPCQPWPAETEHHPPPHSLTPGINC